LLQHSALGAPTSWHLCLVSSFTIFLTIFASWSMFEFQTLRWCTTLSSSSLPLLLALPRQVPTHNVRCQVFKWKIATEEASPVPSQVVYPTSMQVIFPQGEGAYCW
jgi:hypothetical protein